MRKIYKLTTKHNYASFVLTGVRGNTVRYDFTKGNVLANTPAKLALENEYAQQLLENSQLFSNGTVKLERVISDNADAGKEKKKQLKKVMSVTNVTEAIEYMANNYSVKVKNTKEAIKEAEARDIVFPKLKTKE